jgi:hypothetical protein
VLGEKVSFGGFGEGLFFVGFARGLAAFQFGGFAFAATGKSMFLKMKVAKFLFMRATYL